MDVGLSDIHWLLNLTIKDVMFYFYIISEEIKLTLTVCFKTSNVQRVSNETTRCNR